MATSGEPVVLVDGIGMGESVRVHDGAVWWADWSDRTVHRLPLLGGVPELVFTASSMPVCFDWSGGDLLVVDGGAGRVLSGAGDTRDLGVFDPHPWNEITTGSGFAFVNGIGFEYGTASQASGLIATLLPDGSVLRAADGLDFPNGMAVLGDVLVVAESNAGRLTAFDIDRGGMLRNRRVWAEVEGSAPDGISPGPDGSLWYADVPNAECVQVVEGGEVLRRIPVGKGCFSCAWHDGTLYVAAADWPGVFAGGPPSGQLLAVPA
jgi:sugar lactone lactonase YvrE